MPVLLSLPLMCYAVDWKEVWSACKDLYKDMYTNRLEICRLILDNYGMCRLAAGFFRCVTSERTRNNCLSILRNSKLIPNVSAGNYTLYRVSDKYVIYEHSGFMFTNFEVTGQLVRELGNISGSAIAKECTVVSGNETVAKIPSLVPEYDTDVAVKLISKYLSNCKIRGSLNILNEMDRLLKLSGITQGVSVIVPVLSDINTQGE